MILGNKHATEPPVLVNSLKDPVPRAVPKSDQSSPDSPGPFDQSDNSTVQSALEPSTTGNAAVSPTKKAGSEVAPLLPISTKKGKKRSAPCDIPCSSYEITDGTEITPPSINRPKRADIHHQVI